jgi:hypothetical protein
MKHIKLFESFVNEAKTIEIKYMMTPPMSSGANRGELDKIENKKELIAYLSDPSNFTDDEVFTDSEGFNHLIDDLIGKKVKIGDTVIEVNESVQESMNAATFAKEWEAMYGEKFATEYKDLYKAMQTKGEFEPADVVAMWDEMYGEDFEEEYEGLYAKLTGNK